LNKEQIPHLLSGVFPPEADQPLGENPAERILSKPFIPAAKLWGIRERCGINRVEHKTPHLKKVRDKKQKNKPH